jgi:ankyrin repeat protein
VKHLPVNAEDKNGMAAINFVTESFHTKGSSRSRRKVDTQDNAIQVIQVLVKAGADINHKNAKGQTALMRALNHGEYNIVKVLLDLGAEVNAVDAEGHNALHFAFYERSKSGRNSKYIFKLNEKRKKTLVLLAQRSVVIDLPDLNGKTVKDIALQQGAIEVVQFLETLSDIKTDVKQLNPIVATVPETFDKGTLTALETKQKKVQGVVEKEILLNTIDTERMSDGTESLSVDSNKNITAIFEPEKSESDQQDLLYKAALSAIKRSRLSKPKGDSALDKLNDLSALTSENDSRVLELRRKISEKYLSLARSRFNDYRYQDAKKFIKASQDIQPSKTATQFRAKVDQRIAEEDYIQQQNNYISNQPNYSQPKKNKAGLGEIFKSFFD